MNTSELNLISPYELLSPFERQREFEKMLDKIPRFYRGDAPMDHNLGFVNSLAELLCYSKGTKSSTKYILKKTANNTINVVATQRIPNEFDPSYIASFPETAYDQNEGAFGKNPLEYESRLLTGYEALKEVGDLVFIHQWKQEIQELYGVSYRSPFL